MTDVDESADLNFAVGLDEALVGVRDVDLRQRMISLFCALWRMARDPGQPPTVIVLTARRMACLYALALSCGLDPRNRLHVVISDRFTTLLDLPHGWSDYRVILLDDIVDTGNTFRNRHDALSKYVPAGIGASAICVTDRSHRRLLRGAPELGLPIMVNRERARSLATDLAASCNRGLIPLITDFPISEMSECSPEDLDRVFEDASWACVEVTNSLSVPYGVRSFSLLPHFDSFQAIGVPTNLVELFKIRLFVRHASDRLEYRIVPIVTFVPLESASVAKYFRELSYKRLAGDSHGTAYGLMSFVASMLLLEHVRKGGLLPIEAPPVDGGLAGLYLGENLYGRIIQEFNPELLSHLPLLTPAMSDSAALRSKPPTSFSSLVDSDHLATVGDDLVAVIARRLERRQSRSFADLAMEIGFSPTVLSLGVDILNDVGWSVPSNQSRPEVDERCLAGGEISDGDMPVGFLGGRWSAVTRTMVRQRPDRYGQDLATVVQV